VTRGLVFVFKVIGNTLELEKGVIMLALEDFTVDRITWRLSGDSIARRGLLDNVLDSFDVVFHQDHVLAYGRAFVWSS